MLQCNDVCKTFTGGRGELEALRDIGDSRSFAAARACLGDRSPLVRSYAAVAVTVIDPSRARPLIRRAARDDRSSTARIGYLDALFTLGERKALGDLTRLLRSRQCSVRSAAANTLANLELRPAERAEVRRAIDAALAVESTVAARSNLEGARRVLGRRAAFKPIADGGLPPGADVSNREQMMDWVRGDRESHANVRPRTAGADLQAARAAVRPRRRGR
jgi:hypothetical protein